MTTPPPLFVPPTPCADNGLKRLCGNGLALFVAFAVWVHNRRFCDVCRLTLYPH